MALMGFNSRQPTDFTNFISDLEKKDVDLRPSISSPTPKEERFTQK
jgi:hypothetical protein